MRLENYWKEMALALMVSTVAYGICVLSYTLYTHEAKVQSGYIAPSRIEIMLKDLDGNGENETILQLNNLSGGKAEYLLKEINGKPVLCEYELQVVPKE